jgi:CDP-diacylglycerol--serine O-phosphatidyltransferase
VSGPGPANRAPRRRARTSGRGLAWLLPHLFTTGNLAAGFYAVVTASAGDLDRAALAVIVAGIFDALDGRVARRVGSASPFGKEYDSIADTVSFGVAPATIAFGAGTLQELGWTGWVLAFFYTACAALRLARFNVTPGRYSGRFQGLPSPAAAGMVAVSVWFSSFMRQSGAPLALPPLLPGLGVATLGILMVSSMQVRIRGSYRALVVLVLGFAVVLLKPSLTFFMLGLGYVSSGPIELLWRWRTGQQLEPIVPSDPIVPDAIEEPGS